MDHIPSQRPVPAAAGATCQVWGVVNVTPDSFSDGGCFFDPDAAISHGLRLLDEGAAVLDVGGESTRPRGATYGAGAQPVDEGEELRRVLPVVEGLAAVGRGLVSIDTTKPAVAARALNAGASIVNDVSCARDPLLLAIVARAGAQLVIMHNRGQGTVGGPNIRYGDVVADVHAELMQAVTRARRAGVSQECIWIDPGLGFAKTWQQSLRLLAHTVDLVRSGLPVLVGPSRKSFIAEAAPDAQGRKPSPDAREPGTLAAVALAAEQGAAAVRVHDVRSAHQVTALVASMRHAAAGSEVSSVSGAAP